MSFETWLDILRCPACVTRRENAQPDPGQLDLLDNGWLCCLDCQRKYPIRNQIPVLKIEEGDKYQETAVADLGAP
jgi:uncharacterized protein YbaR (Trm112 family)